MPLWMSLISTLTELKISDLFGLISETILPDLMLGVLRVFVAGR